MIKRIAKLFCVKRKAIWFVKLSANVTMVLLPWNPIDFPKEENYRGQNWSQMRVEWQTVGSKTFQRFSSFIYCSWGHNYDQQGNSTPVFPRLFLIIVLVSILHIVSRWVHTMKMGLIKLPRDDGQTDNCNAITKSAVASLCGICYLTFPTFRYR